MHESDITPGLANKLCKPFAKSICTTFPECAKLLAPKGVQTGTPLRAQIFSGDRARGLKLAGFDGGKPVLMMIGGSLGAQSVNAVLRAALPELTKKFDVLHVCGKGNLDASLVGVPGYRQFEYLSDELPDAFACADIMLSRAGSNSLSELMALCKPALLIPYHSGRGDQVLNAKLPESARFGARHAGKANSRWRLCRPPSTRFGRIATVASASCRSPRCGRHAARSRPDSQVHEEVTKGTLGKR